MAAKRNEYFDTFTQLVQFSCEAANFLHETLQNFDTVTLKDRIHRMHEIEHGADTCKHAMMEKLAKEFITPIEREDIIELAQEIDDVTDSIEDVLQRMYMYCIKSVRPDALAFSQTITDCCQALKAAVEEFYNFRKSQIIHDSLVKVNTLEETGDALYLKAVRSLYEEGGDPVSVVAWSETFDRLERCCDACEHVANVIEGVIMKNS